MQSQGRPAGAPDSQQSWNQNVPSRQSSPTAGSLAAGKRSASRATVRRVCYFRMDPKTEIRLNQVDGDLCTHVILASVRIDTRGQLVVASQSDLDYLAEVPEFKRRFPGVRVMVSVFNEPEFNGFPSLVNPTTSNSPSERLNFARSAMEFLRRHQLDGIDLDWEFPNFPASFLATREHERVGLTKILKSLRSAIVEDFYDRQLSEQHEQSSRASSSLSSSAARAHSAHLQAQYESHVEPYLLTVAIGGQEAILRASYELKRVANLCDWLNVMSYDYFLFKAYSPFTGPNSPLYPIVEHYVPFLGKLSLSWTASRLLEEGVEEDKIVMGVPCYARAYRLLFRNTQPVPFTLSAGSKGGQIEDHLNYREVLAELAREGTIVELDQRARVPYLLTDNGYTWISYENPQSVREKVRFILDKGLGGYMTWNLNSDDFLGTPPSLTSHPPAPDGQLANGINHSGGHSGVTFPLHRAMLDEVARYFEES